MQKKFLALLICLLLLPVSAWAQGEWNIDLTVPVNPHLLALTAPGETLGEEYEPHNLHQISSKQPGVKLTVSRANLLCEDALDSLYAMLADAQQAGLTIYVRQAYRSYADEARRYQLTGEGPEPGKSSYQTGYSVTLVNETYKKGDIGADFAQSPEGVWLMDNCHLYGFTLRYPAGREEVTGHAYEPWHFRYVGKDIAAALKENGLSLEDFRLAYDAAEQVGVYVDPDATPTPPPTPTPAPTPTPTPLPEGVILLEETGADGDFEFDFEYFLPLTPAP